MQKQVRTLREDMDNSKSAAEAGNRTTETVMQPRERPGRVTGMQNHGSYGFRGGKATNAFGGVSVPTVEGFGDSIAGKKMNDGAEDYMW